MAAMTTAKWASCESVAAKNGGGNFGLNHSNGNRMFSVAKAMIQNQKLRRVLGLLASATIAIVIGTSVA